ncbi:hypothetical protein [Hymenobacter pini]|uniref:hypothetical protein n=1 Tax=Hymenobacter pini TaxID=2880879 RepID=UPI001CF433DE|nr:hypothetical protein [Hymenobacter pini]MCA8830983.1 hypothetical protein [Hymenobacter pini]
MKKKLLILGVSLLSCWAVPTVQMARATSVTKTQTHKQTTADYLSGYSSGSNDARDAKCSFRGSEAGYNDWYYSWRSYAAYYRDEAGQSGDVEAYEYWSGYYDGLAEGYNLQPFCGGSGGGGGPIEQPPYVGG